MMTRIVSVAIVLLVAIPVFPRNRAGHQSEQMFIATTGRIKAIDGKAQSMTVRNSEDLATCKLPKMGEMAGQRIEINTREIIVPAAIRTAFAETTGKGDRSEPASVTAHRLDEYTVVTTSDTVFRDGGDSIRFEDFKNCEVISIHGRLKGRTLTASRVAKWN